MRFARATFLLLLAALVLGGAAARPAAKSGIPLPRVEILPLEIEASEDLAWNFEIHVVNAFGVGLYTDSVSCHVEDRDPGETHAPRVTDGVLFGAKESIGDVSAGDSTAASQVLPATCENGTLRLRVYFHRSDGTKFSVETAAAKLVPGPVSKDHPSEFVTAGGKKVETVLFPARPEGPAAGLLFVHDEGSNARHMMVMGGQLSMRGYTTLFVSVPGYGLSEGPADFSGARGLAALGAALDRLKRTPGVDSLRLAAWGIGRGATAVVQLAAERSDLKAVVAQSGAYDAALAPRIHAATAIVHGGADHVAPVEQAQAFAAALSAAGDSVWTRIYPASGHALGRPEMQRGVYPFLDTKLKR